MVLLVLSSGGFFDGLVSCNGNCYLTSYSVGVHGSFLAVNEIVVSGAVVERFRCSAFGRVFTKYGISQKSSSWTTAEVGF